MLQNASYMFLKNKTKQKKNKQLQKKEKISPGGSRTQDFWCVRAMRYPLRHATIISIICQITVFNIFCPWNCAGGRCLKFMKNWKIYSMKASRVLTVKAVLLSHIFAFLEMFALLFPCLCTNLLKAPFLPANPIQYIFVLSISLYMSRAIINRLFETSSSSHVTAPKQTRQNVVMATVEYWKWPFRVRFTDVQISASIFRWAWWAHFSSRNWS